PTAATYALSLHDALPISAAGRRQFPAAGERLPRGRAFRAAAVPRRLRMVRTARHRPRRRAGAQGQLRRRQYLSAAGALAGAAAGERDRAMKRRHGMPFSAAVIDGGVRFRLWAPSARDVALCLEGGPELPMPEAGGGWRELVTREAGAGSRYRFRINGELLVPDPASRYNPGDVHGASEVIDPEAFDWQDDAWRGRLWDEAVIYELHVGSFSEAGSFAGVEQKLDHLAGLGITAIEL